MASHAAPSGPPCPRCSATAVWHPQLNQWGCDQCRQMLQAQPPVMQAQPYAMQSQPHGMQPHAMQAQPHAMQAQPHGMQPPTAPLAPPGPPCPRCNTPGVWHPQAAGWGCDRCQAPIGPGLQQMPAQGSGAGGIVLKIVIFVVVVIVLVAIKVGIRGAFR